MLSSGQTTPSNQSACDVYDGKNIYCFDNSSESKLVLTSKAVNTDSSLGKAVVSLGRNAESNISQTITDIAVAGNWIYFRISNVDYNNPSSGWRGYTRNNRDIKNGSNIGLNTQTATNLSTRCSTF